MPELHSLPANSIVLRLHDCHTTHLLCSSCTTCRAREGLSPSSSLQCDLGAGVTGCLLGVMLGKAEKGTFAAFPAASVCLAAAVLLSLLAWMRGCPEADAWLGSMPVTDWSLCTTKEGCVTLSWLIRTQAACLSSPTLVHRAAVPLRSGPASCAAWCLQAKDHDDSSSAAWRVKHMVTTGCPWSKSVLCLPAQDCVRGACNLQFRKNTLLPNSDSNR